VDAVTGDRAVLSRRQFVQGAAATAVAATLVVNELADVAAAAPATLPSFTAKPQAPLYDLEVWEAASLIRSRRLSPVTLAEAILDRIAAVEPRIGTFANLYPADEVLAQAERAESLLRRGRYLGPFHGIPIGLKDIYLTAGKVTEGNSDLYRGFVPSFDATSVARLKAAGAVIVGKTGTSELATANGWPAKNPWDFARAAGGSSTGSATGVAASEVLLAMGTCTGGSIRGPAANCGLTGFKPTYGTISLHGILPLAWTMDHSGPLAHSARDAALLVDTIGGEDPQDPLSRKVARYNLSKAAFDTDGRHPLRGVNVGVPAPGDYFLGVPNDEEIAAYEVAVGVLAKLGATVTPVSTTVLFGGLTSTSSFYDVIRSAEVAAYQYQNLLTQPENMSSGYLARVSSGVLMPGHAYEQAQRVRRLWRDKLLAVFDQCDVLVHPADNIAGLSGGGGSPGARPSSGSKTNVWNLTGAPAVAIPTGFSRAERMPLSMQVVGSPGEDAAVLKVAAAFQTATEHHKARPPL